MVTPRLGYVCGGFLLVAFGCAPDRLTFERSDGGEDAPDVAPPPDANEPSDTTPVPIMPTSDVPASPVDVPASAADVSAPPADVPASAVDVPAPPTDVPAPPADVPAPPADVHVPPADVPSTGPTCGASGQDCCAAGVACRGAGQACLDWGWGRVCGACGGLGQPCCPGGTCASGSMCTSTQGGALSICTSFSASFGAPGGGCLRAMSDCGRAATACVNVRLILNACASCGSRGQPCCWGGACPGGGACQGSASGVQVCR